MRTEVAALTELLGTDASPRLERLAHLTIRELWETAEPHLVAHVPATADDMALLRETLWDRVDAARAELAGRRRDPAPRNRLLRMADQLDAVGTDDDRRTAAEVRRLVR